jgi:hypothetical protein
MPTPLESEASRPFDQSQVARVATCNVRGLISFAVRGLGAMFDPKEQLFCHRLKLTRDGLVREGVSPRYTIMTLLGLRELESTGAECPFDIRGSYVSLIRNTAWVQGVGDLGLLIWLTAAFDPGRLVDLFRTFSCETALDRYSDARESRTMELAWLLAGLAHAAEVCPELVGPLTDLCVKTYHRLEENQGECGLFGHMGAKKSFAGRIRGHIGSFADQVYPMYAMAKFAKFLHVEDPLRPAMECANAICGAQGELGQWWWLYDARSARVSSHYPVYSVHQHGMAPMGLFAVEEVTGQSFNEFIYKGLDWIHGANELGVDMKDRSQNVIWRCLLPRRRQTKYREFALSVIRARTENTPTRMLKILCEQRPYEFGWLLFALARKSQLLSRVKKADTYEPRLAVAVSNGITEQHGNN